VLPGVGLGGRNAQGCLCEGAQQFPPAGSRFKFTVFGSGCASWRESVVKAPLSGPARSYALPIFIVVVVITHSPFRCQLLAYATFQVTRRPGPGCP
jgi:hypothetical protein